MSHAPPRSSCRGSASPSRCRSAPASCPSRGRARSSSASRPPGVSFAEQQMRRGKYYDQPPFPFVPGYDLVGVVERSGDGGGARGRAARRRAHEGRRLGRSRPARRRRPRAAARPGSIPSPPRRSSSTASPRGGCCTAARAGPPGPDDRRARRRRRRRLDARPARPPRRASASSAPPGPSQQERLRELGAIAVDYRNEDVPARVRELAPDGVAAVFDHVGGPGITDSWRMLARGGTLVSYGTASTRDVPGNPRLPVLKLLARLTAWNLLPNGRRATFFNLWAGRRLRPARYRAELREDLRRCSGSSPTARSPRRSRARSRSPTPPPRCATPRPAGSPARSCSCRSRRVSGGCAAARVGAQA